MAAWWHQRHLVRYQQTVTQVAVSFRFMQTVDPRLCGPESSPTRRSLVVWDLAIVMDVTVSRRCFNLHFPSDK